MIDKSKIQKLPYLVFLAWFLLGIWNLGFGILPVHAKDVVLLYTGETHAMLYPCNCPKEPDGGLAHRAAQIKKLRSGHPDLLLLDAGAFFAGGLLDEYTQNTQLDMERTHVNLKAMEKMGYDALSIGDNEFNFGKDFLFDAISKTSLSFLSCNVKTPEAQGIKPFIIKDVSGTKVGIIGVTNLAAHHKSGSFRFSEPKQAVEEAVEELKKAGVDIIVLLSQLEENVDLNLIKEVKGIDVLIGSHHPIKDGTFVKFENTLLLKTFWQGRSLGIATLTVENNRLTQYKVDEVRLSGEIEDDPDILEILPRCFSDSNCRREGLTGSCQNPGTPEADCLFSTTQKIDLVVITDESCVTCNPEAVIDFLKKDFPGISPIYLYYHEKKAKDLIKDFGISGLPAYLLSKEVQKEEKFDSFKENLEARGDFYLVKTTYSGVSYLFNRKKIKGQLDLFISLYDKNAKMLLEVIQEFNPKLHFLATQEEARFDAAQGEPEVEEYLRAVCVQKYYPRKFWEYARCRSKNIHSAWWDDCALALNVRKIKTCAQGPEGVLLLKDHIRMSEELHILFGPTYLLNNQEIFISNGVPGKEELKAIVQR